MTQLMERPTEASVQIALSNEKKQNKFVVQKVVSGIAILAMSVTATSNFNVQNNSMDLNRHLVIKNHKDEYASSQYPNNVFDLGAYSGAKEFMNYNPQENDIVDFKYAVHAIDNLKNIDVLPASKVKTYRVGAIKKTSGKILPPDEDDFLYVNDSDFS